MTPLTLPGQTTLDARVTGEPVDADLVVLGLLGHPGHRLRPDGAARGPDDHRGEPGGDGPAGRAPGGADLGGGGRAGRELPPAGVRGPDLPYDRARPQLVERARAAAAGLDPHETAMAVASLVADQVSYIPGTTGVNTAAGGGLGAGRGRLPGHRPPDDRRCCARSACRPAMSPATSTPSATRNSTAPSKARATPGSSTGRATGPATTPPTASAPTSPTWSWAGAATTTT